VESLLVFEEVLSDKSGQERNEVEKELRIRRKKGMIPRDNFQEGTSLSHMDHPWRGITLLKGAEGNLGP
jgi:hypothetical protein